jgi:hypothetical protein
VWLDERPFFIGEGMARLDRVMCRNFCHRLLWGKFYQLHKFHNSP